MSEPSNSLPLAGEGGGEGVFSDWIDFNFTLDFWQNSPPVVTSLVLGNDTGPSNTDGVTTDPRLKGQAINDGGVLHMTIEFDWNGDDTVDGTTITDREGTFSYLPQGVSPGEITVRARAKARDFSQEDFETGDWTSLSFTLEAGGPPSPPTDPIGETAGAAYDLAVTTAIETFNSNVSGTSNGTTLNFQNARFSPDGAQSGSNSSGTINPIEETAFTVATNPSVPTNFSHSSTTQVTKSGATASGGNYSSTSDVTTSSNVTASPGAPGSGSFSESESVCDSFSHSETGLGYSMTSSGSFCFSYSVSSTYSVAADGSVSIAGGYTITVTSNYSYTYNSTDTEVVSEPNFSASETVSVSDSGNGSFTYNENGSFLAGSSTVTLKATAQYSLSASANGSLIVIGNYAGSFPMPSASATSASASFGGSYVLTASDNATFSSSGLAGIGVNGSNILITASNTVTSSSMSTFNLTDSGNSSGGGSSSNYTMTLSDFSQSSGFASVSATLTHSSASVVGAFSSSSLNIAQFAYNEGGSHSSPSASSTYTLSVTADSVGISASGGNLLATQSSANISGNFIASGNSNSTENYKESGSYNYADRSGSYKLSSGGKNQFTSLVAGGFAVSDSGGFVGVFFNSSSSGDTYYDYADAGTATGPGVTSNYSQATSSKGTHSSGVNGSAFAGSTSIASKSGSSGSFYSNSDSQFRSTYAENGTKTGGVNSTFSRSDIATMNSWSNTNGQFYSSNGASTTIGTFDTGNVSDYRSNYNENGTVWGNNFDTGWSSIYTATATDGGSFTTTSTGSNVSGNSIQSSNSVYQSHDHQWGSSGSTNFDVQGHSSSTNTSSSNGTYTVSPSASSSSGSYSSSQIFDSGQTNHTWGSYTIDGDTTNFDENVASSYNSTNSDSGTFSSSGGSSSANGTATAYTSSTSSHVRTENGTRTSGGVNSTFNMSDSNGGYQISSTTSNYSSSSGGSGSASGPYSFVSNTASSYSYNENGTTASGATFALSKSSWSTSAFNDNGNFNDSTYGSTRNGNYTNSSSSGSNYNRAENGNLTGDGVTGTYASTVTIISNDSATDTAGYSRSAAGFSGGGNHSSGHSDSSNSTYSASGSRTSPERTSNFTESNTSSVTNSKSDSGTFSFSPSGTTANGTVTRSGNSNETNNSSESGNDLGCESGTFSQFNNDSEVKTNTATGTYSRSNTGST